MSETISAIPEVHEEDADLETIVSLPAIGQIEFLRILNEQGEDDRAALSEAIFELFSKLELVESHFTSTPACDGLDYKLFFPKARNSKIENQKTLEFCKRECQIRTECLDIALRTTTRALKGSWGGYSNSALRKLKRTNLSAEEIISTEE